MSTNGIDSFGEVLLWSFWIFIWISAIFIWFRCVFDMFSDRTLSGWGKAGWTVVLVLVPWVGVLIYLVLRGSRTPKRRPAAGETNQVATIDPAAQIASAKSLLNFGAITQAEYDALKAKALG